MLRWVLAAALAVTAAPAFSDPMCESLLASGLVSEKPAIFAFVALDQPGNAATGQRWKLLKDGQTLANGSEITFAVAATASQQAQMLVLKTKWRQTDAPDATTVWVARDAYRSRCHLFGIFPYFPTAVHVGIDRYLAYHHFGAKFSPALIQFHVNYVDQDGNCAATDDVKNGNIQQFLFGEDADRTIAPTKESVDQIAANLSRALAPGEARAAPLEIEKLLLPYRNYSQIETQIIPRPDGEDLCHLVDPAGGAKITAADFALATLYEGRAKKPVAEVRVKIARDR